MGIHLEGRQHGVQKPKETPVTEFCYKSVNIPLEELTNIKVIFFLIHYSQTKSSVPPKILSVN